MEVYDEAAEKLFKNAILLELKMAHLYLLFKEMFKEDVEFWWKLSLEEINHASLIKGISYLGELTGQYPKSIVPERVEMIENSRKRIEKELEKYEHGDYTRFDALKTAYELELIAGEVHCQTFIPSIAGDEDFAQIKEFNKNDIEHAARIKQYLESVQSV
ncbi:MAG: hypothetical protein K9G76_03825 [Bacteroidales bacterium]|nr:hypothetical protein [Bacteroidales bacterium]MCF8402924.1 hypothetical protein [Bacteroidales bacterium]